MKEKAQIINDDKVSRIVFAEQNFQKCKGFWVERLLEKILARRHVQVNPNYERCNENLERVRHILWLENDPSYE